MAPTPPAQDDDPALFVFDHVAVERDGAVVLRDVCAAVPSAGVTVVAGSSGAGKSTLLRLCNRLDVPSAGQVRFRYSRAPPGGMAGSTRPTRQPPRPSPPACRGWPAGGWSSKATGRWRPPGQLGRDGPGPEDVPELRRLLYGLHAIVRMHVAQEEEEEFVGARPSTPAS